ncbi:asparagine synthetase B family protein [Salinarimonas ramus]|uniref:asparagine synthase (glutamine-hydrolyzing) n=1 Tax=Salinarimonas ramus TaxID=690164 RepID=A0A917Q9H9_9HYPH|nr:asparagine synthase-related protein [Salinarimonas ramus]GGK37742.1 asparagine synthetase B [Salinarimonas ramus]
MKGLVAHLPLDGAPAGPGTLAAVLAAQAHRGETSREIASGAARLGIRERADEASGLAGDDADGPALVGDLRLDDTAALAEILGLPRDTAPARLALAAYERWGDAFAERLEGEFALVIHDPRRRRLVAVRDRFGVKPLYVHADRAGLTFASELGALLAALPAPPPHDPEWIADYLAGTPSDASRTAYRDIRRLAPGHVLVAEAGRMETRPYWTLVPEEPTDGSGAEILRDLLEDAVARRIEAGRTGAMLSGGLDSSSIARLAARGGGSGGPSFPVFTLAFAALPEIDERRHVDAVLAMGGLAPHRLVVEAPDAILAGRALLTDNAEPLPAPGLVVTRALYEAAARAGVDILLNGHGGDEVVNDGVAHLPDLARAGRLGALWRGCGAAAALYGGDRTATLLESLAGGAGWPLGGIARRLHARRAGANDPRAWRRIVSDEAARRTRLVERRRESRSAASADLPRATRAHFAALTGPRSALGFDVLDRAAASHGVEPRYPFFDRRVVAHCLSRLPEEKLAEGRTRALLRGAMAGVLPESVRLRPDKTDFRAVARASLAAPASRAFLAALAADPDAVADHVDVAVLRENVSALARGEDDVACLVETWRASQLALFLGAKLPDEAIDAGRRHDEAHARMAKIPA